MRQDYTSPVCSAALVERMHAVVMPMIFFCS